MQEAKWLDIGLEMPFLLLALGLLLSIIFGLVGRFTSHFQGYRWKIAVAPFAFSFMGLLGLFATVRFKILYLTDWLANSSYFESISLLIFLFGYLFFGALGCWLAVRIVHRLDTELTLKTLYTVLKTRKQD